MSVEISDLKARIEGLELANSKKYVSISGLQVEGRKFEEMQQIESFIQDYLGVTVTVDDHYKLGTVEPRMLVISFQNAQQRRDVLRFKKF